MLHRYHQTLAVHSVSNINTSLRILDDYHYILWGNLQGNTITLKQSRLQNQDTQKDSLLSETYLEVPSWERMEESPDRSVPHVVCCIHNKCPNLSDVSPRFAGPLAEIMKPHSKPMHKVDCLSRFEHYIIHDIGLLIELVF